MFSLKLIPSRSPSFFGTDMPVPNTNGLLGFSDETFSSIVRSRPSGLEASDDESGKRLAGLEPLFSTMPRPTSSSVLTYGFSGFTYLFVVSLHTLFLQSR